MSEENGIKSESESSSSSPTHSPFFQEHFSKDQQDDPTDLTLFGSKAPTMIRSGTVRRVSNSAKYSSSLESFSSDQTDYAMRSETTDPIKDGKTIQSPASSYLSWIESINSAYFGNNNSIGPHHTNADIDSKVGEWNNFWLNYSNENARKRYLSSPYPSADEKTFQVEDFSEGQSSSTTQKELTDDRNSTEYVSLTVEEIQEALKCSKRITEIMQNALTRNEHDCDMYNRENSVYSETQSSLNNSSLKEENIQALREDMMNVSRERSYSYIINTQELIKQKESLKPSIQASSTSCINALMNTGVADMLKRVINKRRDVMTPDDLSSMTRRSFSEWSNK
ncbi:unnamed protein product [Phaedon cochleariae]|uniref:Uncharacterized protein n=1 Tax=Phaedon cochleariae TaxID=80249 RepID=A0A9N9SLJ6_PHACE|nr:unnamed protein product [Phaedon cochleariae]